MSEEQKTFAPCPFCADEVAFIEPDGDGIYHAECQRCGAHGPVESAEDRAISSWNRRILGAAPDDGFSREELQALVALSAFETRPLVRLANLAAFALTLLDKNEECRKTLEAIKKHLEISIGDGTKLSTTYKLVEAALSELDWKEEG